MMMMMTTCLVTCFARERVWGGGGFPSWGTSRLRFVSSSKSGFRRFGVTQEPLLITRERDVPASVRRGSHEDKQFAERNGCPP